jgi:hypothetical protein
MWVYVGRLTQAAAGFCQSNECATNSMPQQQKASSGRTKWDQCPGSGSAIADHFVAVATALAIASALQMKQPPQGNPHGAVQHGGKEWGPVAQMTQDTYITHTVWCCALAFSGLVSTGRRCCRTDTCTHTTAAACTQWPAPCHSKCATLCHCAHIEQSGEAS